MARPTLDHLAANRRVLDCSRARSHPLPQWNFFIFAPPPPWVSHRTIYHGRVYFCFTSGAIPPGITLLLRWTITKWKTKSKPASQYYSFWWILECFFNMEVFLTCFWRWFIRLLYGYFEVCVDVYIPELEHVNTLYYSSSVCAMLRRCVTLSSSPMDTFRSRISPCFAKYRYLGRSHITTEFPCRCRSICLLRSLWGYGKPLVARRDPIHRFNGLPIFGPLIRYQSWIEKIIPIH